MNLRAAAVLALSLLCGGCATLRSPDGTKPNVQWVAAHANNFRAAQQGQPPRKIRYLVLHTVEGTYEGCIRWFQNPQSKVSAHYVISRSGEITQMVRDEDIAFHAGNWKMNTLSLGIEHEGYAHKENQWTVAQMRASAALARWLCLRYRIPTNRRHILGHVEVPRPSTHTDPGEFFDWDYYLFLVRGGGRLDPKAPAVANPPPWRKMAWPKTRNQQKQGLGDF